MNAGASSKQPSVTGIAASPLHASFVPRGTGRSVFYRVQLGKLTVPEAIDSMWAATVTQLARSPVKRTVAQSSSRLETVLHPGLNDGRKYLTP